MSKREKRYRKIREQPHKVRFQEIEIFLVKDLEFEEISRSGSHVIFEHEDYRDEQENSLQIVIPRPHGKRDTFVKKYYVRRMLTLLDDFGILVDYGMEDS